MINFGYKFQFWTSHEYQSRTPIIMKKSENKNREKEKKLQTTSFTFKKRKVVRPTFVWWGWKTT